MRVTVPKSSVPPPPVNSRLQTFRTDINCGSCIAAVTGFLDDLDGVSFWRVDTAVPERVLFVEGVAREEDILAAVRAAGYRAEPFVPEEAP